MQVGVPAPGVTYAVPITHLTQVDRGIIGSRAGGVRAQKDIPIIAEMYKKGLLDLDSMVSKTYPMERTSSRSSRTCTTAAWRVVF